jgi:hypothetical protein
VKAIVVRCSNGLVVWRQQATGLRTREWICTRDNVALQVPADETVIEQFLVTLAQHSSQLAGTIQQVVELDI